MYTYPSLPCVDCGLLTLPRDRNGNPQKGKCEYFRVPNSLWQSVARDADFLCVGCLENRLTRKLKWQDFLIFSEEIVGAPPQFKFVWTVTSPFDTPRLTERKHPGPSHGQARRGSIYIIKPIAADFQMGETYDGV